MKYILVLLLLLTGVAYGQTTYFIRADTTKLQKVGASNELVILNDTRDTLGALVNIGGGKTAFQRGRASGDTLFLGRDTIIGIGAGGSAFTPAITPPTITSNQNNYNPTGLATAAVLRLDADAPWSITGLEGGVEGKTLVLHNIGSPPITFPAQDGSSDAENQFLTETSLLENGAGLFRYDGTLEKWVSIAVSTPTLQQVLDVEGGVAQLNKESGILVAPNEIFAIVAEGNDSKAAELSIQATDMDNPKFVMEAGNGTSYVSGLQINQDTIILYPHLGNFHIDSLDHIPNPGTNKMMVWDSATGHVGTRLLPSGGGGSGTVTEVTATDANNFDFTVTNTTTTPDIQLAVSGDLDGQLLWANGGSLLGVTIGSGLSFNTGTATLSATGGGGIAIGDAVTGGNIGAVLFVDASGDLGESDGFKYGAGGLDLGENGVSQGALNLFGTTSGTIKITTAAAAGSYTAELPTTAGTEGQVLTKGSGNAWTWSTGGISMGYSLFADTLKSGSTVLSITNRAQVNEEFISTSASSGAQGYFYDASAGTGADVSANQKTFTGNIGGIAVFTTGTTNTGAGYLASAPTYYPIDTNNYYRIGYYNLRLEDLSDGTETYLTRFGFMLGETVQNEIYFKYTHSLNSGAWTCYSENGTTAESTASGVTVAADTDYDLEIEFQGATVKFWINGTLVATHTTQVPQHANIQGIAGPYTAIIKSAGTTARVMYVDAIKVRVDHKSAVQN